MIREIAHMVTDHINTHKKFKAVFNYNRLMMIRPTTNITLYHPTNPKYRDQVGSVNYYDEKLRIHVYGSPSIYIEYADPKMFTRIDTVLKQYDRHGSYR